MKSNSENDKKNANLKKECQAMKVNECLTCMNNLTTSKTENCAETEFGKIIGNTAVLQQLELCIK